MARRQNRVPENADIPPAPIVESPEEELMSKRPVSTQEDEPTINLREETPAPEASGPVEQKVLDFAEDLGRLLGTAQNKATAWLEQRKTVTSQLVQIRDAASQMLSQLGHQVSTGYEKAAGKRRGRPPGSGAKKTAKAAKGTAPAAKRAGRRKFTAAQKAEAAARMKAYWANKKKA